MISMAPPYSKHCQGFIGKSYSWLTNTPANRNFKCPYAEMKRKCREANEAVESDIVQVSHQKMQDAFSLLEAIANKLKLIDECENKWESHNCLQSGILENGNNLLNDVFLLELPLRNQELVSCKDIENCFKGCPILSDDCHCLEELQDMTTGEGNVLSIASVFNLLPGCHFDDGLIQFFLTCMMQNKKKMENVFHMRSSDFSGL